jgi:hypothetical protein
MSSFTAAYREKRPELVDRFHKDPECRFLSTDAGGANPQHAAATIVNMDMP